VCCSVLQCVTVRCSVRNGIFFVNTGKYTFPALTKRMPLRTQQRSATHCNTLQHTATHTATHTLQRTGTDKQNAVAQCRFPTNFAAKRVLLTFLQMHSTCPQTTRTFSQKSLAFSPQALHFCNRSLHTRTFLKIKLKKMVPHKHRQKWTDKEDRQIHRRTDRGTDTNTNTDTDTHACIYVHTTTNALEYVHELYEIDMYISCMEYTCT